MTRQEIRAKLEAFDARNAAMSQTDRDMIDAIRSALESDELQATITRDCMDFELLDELHARNITKLHDAIHFARFWND